ncbi:MAG TPA: SDR family oxidoreductase [Pseudonocardiaceae bacterium]|jgi:NAD(P)-dependent dehydrogenase (short-subunit alcohol dehydrogenase family)|nr:SDR family oxidoreductase [Pseudonocardiaceae bacterium]
MTARTIALVTGANKGIGKEIARGLGQRDLTVLAAARDQRRGEQAVAELAGEGLDVRFIQLDVTDDTSISAAAKQIAEEFGRLDILVNNAGILTGGPVPSETDLAVMRKVYDANVFGVVAVTNAMLPLLKLSSAGRIVNVSSGLGSISSHADPNSPLPLYLSYNSSKSALNAITVQYARELLATGIKVNACAPGKCATDLNGHSGERTPAQGAQIAIRLATVDADGPTAGFFDDNGVLPW